MKKVQFVGLTLILSLAAFLRFYRLGDYPPSFWQDICSIGYDAYSLLKTGRDHWGKPFPHLYLRSLGDYKLPLFTYFTIPGVALFGLNEFGVRFPSALFGVLTVLVTYCLVKEIFRDSMATWLHGYMATIASFLLAISPWHIGLTRHGYEAGLAVFFQTLALFLFLKSKKRPLLLPLSSFFFTLTTYTYHSFRIFTPLFFSGLILIFLKDFRKQKRILYLSLFLFFVLIAPSLFSFFTPMGGTRLTVNRFDKTLEWKKRLADCQFACNEQLVFIFTFIKNYFSQFSFDSICIYHSRKCMIFEH